MATGSPVLQSGTVTPAHVPVWTTDGVIQDSGIAITTIASSLTASVTSVSFNTINLDTPIPIALPAGFTKYRVAAVVISGANTDLSSSQVGLFTQLSGGGVSVVTACTPVTVNNGAPDTLNNMQSLPISNQNTMAI